MTIDNPGDVLAIVAILSAVLGGVIWLIRAQTSLARQFEPNGGQSIKDQLNRLEHDLRDHNNRLTNHIDNHGRD